MPENLPKPQSSIKSLEKQNKKINPMKKQEKK